MKPFAPVTQTSSSSSLFWFAMFVSFFSLSDSKVKVTIFALE
jgi:hypothetical protein